MEDDPLERPTRSSVEAAGRRLRRAYRDGGLASLLVDQASRADLDTLVRFRRAHEWPMRLVANRLRIAGREVAGLGRPGQRLKRLPRILEKCARNSTDMTRLQDIAGCRLVVGNLEDQREVVARVLDLFQGARVSDYVADPRGSGYRAVHVIVTFNGLHVEIQVRTQVQDHWANMVEHAEEVTGFSLKDQDGPASLLDYFRVASRIQAREEAGLVVDAATRDELAELRQIIRPYYEQGTAQ